MSLLSLDSLSLSIVLSKLNSAVSCSRLMLACSSLRASVSNDRCWVQLCVQDFWIEHGSYAVYLEQAKEFGKYRSHGFARLRRAFSILDEAFKAASLNVFAQGASEREIDEWERKCDFKLPLVTRASLRLVNGQSSQFLKDAGLGHFSFYDAFIAHYLPSLRMIRDPALLCLVVGTRRSTISFDSYGQVRCGSFVLAQSWPEFVESVAFQVARKSLIVDPSQGLRLFPRLGIPTANTDGIIVSVAVLFVPTDSSPGEHLFTYSIRIRGASDLKFTARLATREWRIKKGLAEPIEVMQGPGVIGLYPVVSPESDFCYESLVSTSGTSGCYMEGHFVFVVEGSQRREVIAQVPRFELIPPPPAMLVGD